MIRRIYAIPLKPDVTRDEIHDVIRVLEDAVRFVPGLLYSTVSMDTSPSPYDLIWNMAFEDEQAYRGYLVHPYHCNIIDQYMYRESPGAIIEIPLPLMWDDQERTDPQAVLDARVSRNAPVTRVATTQPEPDQEPPSGGPGSSEDEIYLFEHVEVEPSVTESYLAAVGSDYVPLVNGLGMRLLGSWRTPKESGENAVFLLWAIAGWDAWMIIRRAFQNDQPGFKEWLERVSPMRTGGKRRLLLAAKI